MGVMPKSPYWFDRDTETSPFLMALAEARRECTRAESVLPHARKRGSLQMIQSIMSAIDDYAECEMGHREYFLSRPHSAG